MRDDFLLTVFFWKHNLMDVFFVVEDIFASTMIIVFFLGGVYFYNGFLSIIGYIMVVVGCITFHDYECDIFLIRFIK